MAMMLVGFAIYSAFCFWVIFMDGVDTLEGWKSFFMLGAFAASLTARELKFYVGISWLASLAVLLFNVFGGS